MTVGIMGAMREEIDPLLAAFGDVTSVDYAANTFYTARYEGIDLVIAYSKIGKVNAAVTATLMCEKFGAEAILFTGVAGGIAPHLTIGDLVIATAVVQHDVDITAFGHPYGFVPESGDFYPTSEALNALARQTAASLGLSLTEGIVATGDQFVADEAKKGWIAVTFDAVALEMEGASVGAVCSMLGVPFMILRSISDTADGDAGISFDEFLVSSAATSAAFMTQMVQRLARGDA